MTRHIYHYNVNAEQRFFLGKERGLFDLVSLAGNIVSHAPSGVAAFVATCGKPFYIDPQTHAFQHATSNLKKDISDKESKEPPRYEFKPSISKLAEERLGGPFASVIANDRPVTVSQFIKGDGSIDESVVEAACNGVSRFQKETMISELDDEAKEFITDMDRILPEFVIAPYFYLSSQRWKDWLRVNIACYRRMKAIVLDRPVYLQLVVSRDVEAVHWPDLIDMLAPMRPDGIVLWIDNHSEEALDADDVKKFAEFTKKLKNLTGTLLNSHGGYLSILLGHRDFGCLDGVGHSINYGEARNVIPVGGGIPMARFYLPAVHSRLRFGDALGVIRSKDWLSDKEKYLSKVCGCQQCLDLLEQKESVDSAFFSYGESHEITSRRRSGTTVKLEYPTAEAKQAAARHYLHNKAHEFSRTELTPLNTLLDELKSTYDDLVPQAGDDLVGHLLNWQSGLNSVL